ncbi:MAG: hypothetical protein HY744_10605 [Deltaproteobacteria bacterium]|nr:hypothetical protein [Deltaproteobacteria bacterium]
MDEQRGSGRRLVSGAALAMVLAGCNSAEQGVVEGRDACAMHAALRAVPSLSAKLRRVAPLVREGERFVLDTVTTDARLVGMAPVRATGPRRIESARDREQWLELEPLDASDVSGVPCEAAVVYRDPVRSYATVVALGHERLEELVVLEAEGAPTEQRYALRLGPGLSGLRQERGLILALDRSGRIAFHTRPSWASDAAGTRRAVTLSLGGPPDRPVLHVSLDLSGLSYPVYVDPEWVPGPGWPVEAVVGLERVRLGKSSHVWGDVAVVETATPSKQEGQDDDVKGGGPFELVLEKSAFVRGTLSANRIRIKVVS